MTRELVSDHKPFLSSLLVRCGFGGGGQLLTNISDHVLSAISLVSLQKPSLLASSLDKDLSAMGESVGFRGKLEGLLKSSLKPHDNKENLAGKSRPVQNQKNQVSGAYLALRIGSGHWPRCDLHR